MPRAADGAEDGNATGVLGLFDVHHERLYRLARRLAPTRDDAQDLVQETFLRVARAPASAPPGTSAQEAWLIRILVNVCRDQWRVRTSRRRLEAQYPTETWTRASASPEAAVIAHTTIWRALDAIAPRRRAVIVLYELEGMSASQIAQLLGVSAVTVRWHLSRGRRELARFVTADEESTP